MFNYSAQKPYMQCPLCTAISPCPCITPQWTTTEYDGSQSSRPARVARSLELGSVCGVKDRTAMPNVYWRTRQCSQCGHEFTTMEIDEDLVVNFVKKGINRAVALVWQSIKEANKKALQAQVISPKLFSNITIDASFEARRRECPVTGKIPSWKIQGEEDHYFLEKETAVDFLKELQASGKQGFLYPISVDTSVIVIG